MTTTLKIALWVVAVVAVVAVVIAVLALSITS